jgi:hypothetical protein
MGQSQVGALMRAIFVLKGITDIFAVCYRASDFTELNCSGFIGHVEL